MEKTAVNRDGSDIAQYFAAEKAATNIRLALAGRQCFGRLIRAEACAARHQHHEYPQKSDQFATHDKSPSFELAEKESPFMIDALHDALTDKFYSELKNRKLI